MLVFVGISMVGLFLAAVVGALLYKNQVDHLLMEGLVANGKKIIQNYPSAPSAELVPYMRSAAGLSNNDVQIYDPDGKPLLNDQEPSVRIDQTYVKHVLAGGIVRQNESRNQVRLVGLPFQIDGKTHALFVAVKENDLLQMINHAVRQVLLISLLFGSLLILAAARYIVKPLLRLTEATKRMAQGKFDIQIRTKRKDEIGQLTASFNEMALELGKLDRMRQDFVANVSHEIQTPLTSISGFTKALKQKKMTEESRLHYLTIIEEESERLSRLSQNLLRLSSLQLEQQPLTVWAYPLDEQLRKVVIALEPQWAAKEIRIDLALEPVTLEADEDQLGQVWTNLLTNGIKFAPRNSLIRVGASLHGVWAAVSFTDNGPGIPEAERADIFRPFHKVDKSRDRAMGGNGLGLSIVKQIVDLHGGEIRVSGHPGEGSTFTVRLPLRRENP